MHVQAKARRSAAATAAAAEAGAEQDGSADDDDDDMKTRTSVQAEPSEDSGAAILPFLMNFPAPPPFLPWEGDARGRRLPLFLPCACGRYAMGIFKGMQRIPSRPHALWRCKQHGFLSLTSSGGSHEF